MKGEPKRKALGKGLGSLIPDVSGTDPLAPDERVEAGAREAAEIPIESIRPNPHQPRRVFDEEELGALADSIRASGILQPLLVRREEDGYTLIAGERRLRAAKLAGLKTVPAVRRDLADERMLEIALVENIQRDDLGPIETAQAFRQLVRSIGLTQAEVADRVGKPRTSVTNYLRLLDLPDEVQDFLTEGRLDVGHGKALAGLADPRLQLKLARSAVDRAWPVRKVEEEVRRLTRPEGVEAGTPAKARRDPNVVAAEKSLERALEASVQIKQGRGGKGAIEIRFAGDEDLDRLYRKILSIGRAGH